MPQAVIFLVGLVSADLLLSFALFLKDEEKALVEKRFQKKRALVLLSIGVLVRLHLLVGPVLCWGVDVGWYSTAV